jgi:hypothetical protein
MVSPNDLPRAEPRWHSRRITAAEVLRLARGEPVPGVSEQDPRVQNIRRCRLTNIARMALCDALRCGYLYVCLTLYEPEVAHNLRSLWGRWLFNDQTFQRTVIPTCHITKSHFHSVPLSIIRRIRQNGTWD